MKPSVVSRLHVSDFRQVGCTYRLSYASLCNMSCIDDTAEEECQKNTVSYQQLPCLALLPDPAPGCQKPGEPPLGGGQDRVVVDLEKRVLLHPWGRHW